MVPPIIFVFLATSEGMSFAMMSFEMPLMLTCASCCIMVGFSRTNISVYHRYYFQQSLIRPGESIGGAPHIRVCEDGSNSRGASNDASKPLCWTDFRASSCSCCLEAANEGPEGWLVAANSLSTSTNTGVLAFVCTLLALSCRTSSSISSKFSCFTALMEYAQTATVKSPSPTPVTAFGRRKILRARIRPGDIPCRNIGQCKDNPWLDTYISLWSIRFCSYMTVAEVIWHGRRRLRIWLYSDKF